MMFKLVYGIWQNKILELPAEFFTFEFEGTDTKKSVLWAKHKSANIKYYFYPEYWSEDRKVVEKTLKRDITEIILESELHLLRLKKKLHLLKKGLGN